MRICVKFVVYRYLPQNFKSAMSQSSGDQPWSSSDFAPSASVCSTPQERDPASQFAAEEKQSSRIVSGLSDSEFVNQRVESREYDSS